MTEERSTKDEKSVFATCLKHRREDQISDVTSVFEREIRVSSEEVSREQAATRDGLNMISREERNPSVVLDGF